MEHSSDILFFIMSAVAILAGLGVVTTSNPVMSSLYLVVSMVGVSGLFFNLNAPFVAAAQIMVYAGAVVVLFLLVLMLFDLKREDELFTRGGFSNFFKCLFLGLFAGLFSTAVFVIQSPGPVLTAGDRPAFAVREVAQKIFTEYLLAFEMLGLLLLVIPIGVVALSRASGGTHAE